MPPLPAQGQRSRLGRGDSAGSHLGTDGSMHQFVHQGAIESPTRRAASSLSLPPVLVRLSPVGKLRLWEEGLAEVTLSARGRAGT